MTARPTPDTTTAPAPNHARRLVTAVGAARVIDLPVDLTADMPQFLGSLVHPEVVELTLTDAEGRQLHGLVHQKSGSWARFTLGADSTARLETGGPRDLWSERAPLLTHWTRAGRPPADAYSLTVHTGGEHELSYQGYPRFTLPA
ncbi:hypothetical protein [Streptomyces synnematoformans]|uniref:Uncharacterized protein n=1 Tax=Streptomyces synnematoformans TaxID=415721 RepID=A0ABN2XNV5_9ACTN